MLSFLKFFPFVITLNFASLIFSHSSLHFICHYFPSSSLLPSPFILSLPLILLILFCVNTSSLLNFKLLNFVKTSPFLITFTFVNTFPFVITFHSVNTSLSVFLFYFFFIYWPQKVWRKGGGEGGTGVGEAWHVWQIILTKDRSAGIMIL